MRFVFGDAYAEYGLLLTIVLAATVLNALQSPISAILQATDRAKSAAILSAATAIVLLPALAAGAVWAGAEGAALGYLLTYAISLGAYLWLTIVHLSKDLE
jgi:O-antigen/teichoic acid export membrane protein